MIVGNGMIATAFKNIDYDLSDYILFASGVSNSKCRDFGEFNREFLTLKNTLDNNKTLIYFSTSSVFDPSLQNSEYVKHKLILEKYIQENPSSKNQIMSMFSTSTSSQPMTTQPQQYGDKILTDVAMTTPTR